MKKVDPLEFPPRDRPEEELEVEPYGFTPDFERCLAAAASTRPRFWPALAEGFQIEGVRQESVQLTLQAAAMITRERGEGPSSPAIVLQRLRSWQEDGKLTRRQVQDVRQLLMEAIDAGVPPDAGLLGEVTPILRRRLQQRALDEGYKALVSRSDLTGTEELLARAKRLGAGASIEIGQRVDASGFEAIRRISRLERLPLGVVELDEELRGGVRELEYWLLAGGTGSGKSMGLNQFFGSALVNGINSAFATIGEVSKDLQYTRLVANLVNIPIDDLEDDMMAEGERRLSLLARENKIAAGYIRYFPAESSVADLKAWVKAIEEARGIPIEALFVDYADKLGIGDDKAKKDMADKQVAEGLRALMYRDEHPDIHLRWVMSATQIKGSAHDRKKVKVVEGHHSADSMAKPRTCDGMWTLNPRDDLESMLWHLTKHRTGKAGGNVGPIPVDFAHGRIAAPERPGWPW